MDCKTFKELAPAMALGALDESERAACAAHLAAAGPHDGCRQAEAEAVAVTARLADVLPDRPVHPRVWRAIEDRIGAPRAAVVGVRRARRRLREWAGWIVAATVVGVHLYNAPVNNASEVGAGRKDVVPPAAPPALRTALALMMGPNTRRYAFQSKPSGSARATLIVDAGLRTAVVLADHVAPAPGEGLRLWAVRAQSGSRAVAVALLTRLGGDDGGMVAADIGTALFEQEQTPLAPPALPGALWLSADPLDAATPRSVLMVANLAGVATKLADPANIGGDQPGN